MLLLPSIVPPTIEELQTHSNEEQQLRLLEQELEAKQAELHDWHRNALVMGKTSTDADAQQGIIQNDGDEEGPAEDPAGAEDADNVVA
ncbi:hypothetical protein DUNSADRAFT_3194 [Dunaliella salina]|uniref:Uncharacterized protein n=1 Tax=Dunaliella salina TaxID=3046 RepID=A0ABQ7FVL2_DUNSA|nr:hypothetical protein DUNSADRAFT_3194 [Dunaliella salina]|eukprot:KAF5826425.1 hypothetical protein DUNSADRAFT_3194 [Dunaliella salina]